MRNKRSRLPARTSELDLQSSEKLNLSRAQIMRRKKTLEVPRPVHCGMKKILAQPDKPVLDAMWTTLINTAPNKCMEGKRAFLSLTALQDWNQRFFHGTSVP